MTDTQFLILHKVRGQPQFDIADKAMFGDEEGWSLCTCGHRAYPYEAWPLSEIRSEQMGEMHNIKLNTNFNGWLKDEIDCWPDHYAQHPEPKLKINVLELVSKMIPRLPRRI